jgi:hypothetical protein
MEVARLSFLQGQPVPVSNANTGYRESKKKEGTMAKQVATKAAAKAPVKKAVAKKPVAKKAAAKKPVAKKATKKPVKAAAKKM